MGVPGAPAPRALLASPVETALEGGGHNGQSACAPIPKRRKVVGDFASSVSPPLERTLDLGVCEPPAGPLLTDRGHTHGAERDSGVLDDARRAALQSARRIRKRVLLVVVMYHRTTCTTRLPPGHPL